MTTGTDWHKEYRDQQDAYEELKSGYLVLQAALNKIVTIGKEITAGKHGGYGVTQTRITDIAQQAIALADSMSGPEAP